MSTASRRALYGKMAGDGTLTGMLGPVASNYGQPIYYQTAPDTANFPMVVFSKQSGVPIWALAAGTPTANPTPVAFENEIWMIKGVAHQGGDQPVSGTPSSAADDAEAIAERLRVLLDDGILSISGVTNPTWIYIRRESDIDYSELAAGETYAHCGSLFRLTYDPKPPPGS